MKKIRIDFHLDLTPRTSITCTLKDSEFLKEVLGKFIRCKTNDQLVTYFSEFEEGNGLIIDCKKVFTVVITEFDELEKLPDERVKDAVNKEQKQGSIGEEHQGATQKRSSKEASGGYSAGNSS